MTNKPTPTGIGGWLILPTIGFILSGLIYVWLTFIYLSFLLDSELDLNFIFFFFALFGALAFFNIYTLIFEFRHKKEFINWAIFLLWIQIPVLLIIDLSFGFEGTTQKIVTDYIWTSIPLLLWILYFKKSTRVKNTFVK